MAVLTTEHPYLPEDLGDSLHPQLVRNPSDDNDGSDNNIDDDDYDYYYRHILGQL